MITLIVTDLKSNEEVLVKSQMYFDYLRSQGLNSLELIKNGYYELGEYLIELAPKNTFIVYNKREFNA